MSIEIKGIITKIVSYPSDTEPTIFKIKTSTEAEEQRCQYTGFFPIKINDMISAKAEKTGNTLVIKTKPLIVVPATKESLKLSFVKALKGTVFGPKKADKLYDELITRYGTTDDIVCKLNQWAVGSHKDEKGNKDSADFVETINKMQLSKLLDWWYKNYNKRRLFLLGLTNKEIIGSKMSENELYECLANNALGVSSLTIEKAIQINNLFSKETTNNDLVAAQVNRYVNKNCSNGLMATPLSEILNMFRDTKDIIPYISKNYNLVFEESLVYTKNSYEIENFLTDKIKSLILKNDDLFLRYGDMPHVVNPIQVDEDIELTEEQHDALKGALSNHISIITGGAGCGKTTLIKQLVKNLIYRKKNFLLTSFTGKAVLRIKETLKCEDGFCYTLSRLIYKKKNYQPVPKFDTLIIDEVSMVSSELIYNFMKYFSHRYSIILIGDCNQLPPIGLGSFFSEVINSGRIPIYRLTENKRISGNSGISNILINANRLIDDRRDLKEAFVFRTSLGFDLIEGDISTCKSILKQLHGKKINKEKITVLTPFNKDIPEINDFAQKIFNKDNMSCVFEYQEYRVGDRVMQTQNVYNEEFEVMNGEEGYISEMNEDFLQVKFSEQKTINYIWKSCDPKIFEKEDEQKEEKEFMISDLKHSFCKTVHKSQGSEYDYVIFYIPMYLSGNNFININLLYTAITRTRKKIWVVGDLTTIERGCAAKLEIKYQKLSQKLQKTTMNEVNHI